MNCNDLPSHDLPPCYLEVNSMLNIKNAGTLVSIDLTKPIDLSLMRVESLEIQPIIEDYDKRQFNLKSVLTTSIINELGESEQLTVTFSRKSSRVPIIKP